MSESKPWLKDGRWHVNPAYWDPEAVELRRHTPKHVRFIDCTMPEGDDCVGHQLNWNTRLGLIQRLDAIGVHAITMPSHSRFDEEEDLARAYRRLGLKAEMVIKGPGIKFPASRGKDWRPPLKRVLAMEPDVLCPTFGWSYAAGLADFKSEVSRDEIVDNIHEVVSYAKSHGVKVVPWVTDTMRTKSDNAVLFCKAVTDAGADGVYIVDSRGNSHPIATRVLVRKIREAIGPRRLYVQHHNDLGLATANALADAEAGADWIDCTVLGIGDRGGTVSLEEAACLFEMYDVATGIDLEGLFELCRYVQDAFGVQLAPWKPVVGANWNKEEGEGHLAGDDSSVASFGIAPEAVGRQMEMVIGNKILFGRERSSVWSDEPAFVRRLLDDWGVAATEEQFNRVVLRAQAAVATTHPRSYITFDEFRSIVDGVVY